jgi:hypothetical protein
MTQCAVEGCCEPILESNALSIPSRIGHLVVHVCQGHFMAYVLPTDKTITLTLTDVSLLFAVLAACDTDPVDLCKVLPDEKARRAFMKSYLHRYFPDSTLSIHRDYDAQFLCYSSIAQYLYDRLAEQGALNSVANCE